MFFTLLATIASKDWLEFKLEDYDALVANSTNRPIFALMHAYWCPMCHGQKERFKAFYNKQSSKLNMTFSLIHCDDREWCRRQGAYSIPYWFVMYGSDPFKWNHTTSTDIRQWQKLVNEASYNFERAKTLRAAEDATSAERKQNL
ncbi:hypothetical protein TVAG_041120 [Trichomonas vaginalis G3]|uniref:Thioredoxin domain-containing protein n=1 Tax=Trichomonas vaginalis (strain ATCC PRA-98 / G3) TaxID=412133 RepID=A2FWS4_TRIV3|nr:thioredoxin-like family [Trichomonas vaginalis G3]EAX90637.1 hypothetical protein TVAG_041120 [Trichomonas vaginalis G3]KAI5502845.1 thioredoxin-like family [Trichomonas vaginalis G3]|eukprot:XP_001303567.1 hypothetical protein [Trichomonas vaginalis G3]